MGSCVFYGWMAIGAQQRLSEARKVIKFQLYSEGAITFPFHGNVLAHISCTIPPLWGGEGIKYQGPFLLIWTDFNPNMDK